MKPDKEHRKDFDEDLRFGEAGERWLLWLGDEAKVEVKRERDLWVKSGCVFIEVSYKGEKSGLASTKADWWIHILTAEGKQQALFAFPVFQFKTRLRELVNEGIVSIRSGGDDGQSRGVVVPISMLYLCTGEPNPPQWKRARDSA